MSRDFSSEVDLAEIVTNRFRQDGYDVYQEVAVTNAVIDIVAVRGERIVAVECKLGLGLDVLAQAQFWRRMTTCSYAAVAWGRRTDSRLLAADVARWLGLGILEVFDSGRVDTFVEPQESGVTAQVSFLRDKLHERQKDYAPAGNAQGQRFTKFVQTCENIARFAQDHPGQTLDELADSIQHHYASTATLKQCIVKYARVASPRGATRTPVIRGIRLERVGRSWRVWPDPPTPISVHRTDAQP